MAQRKKVATRPALEGDSFITGLIESISGKRTLNFEDGDKLFSQGDPADALFFIRSGKVKISVLSTAGKEAIIGILASPGFVGEGALVGHTRRVNTATVLGSSTIIWISRAAMKLALQDQADLSEKFIAALLTRNIDLEADLCDQLFNHSEKRLARVLLKLARLRAHDVVPDARIPTLSHEALAEMVGTTRSRVTYFMNKFRSMGLIDYNGELVIRTEILTDVVLHD